MSLYFTLCFVVIATLFTANAFQPVRIRKNAGDCGLMMTKKGKAEATSTTNLPRKIKRSLKNAPNLDSIYDPAIENFLVKEAEGSIYETIMKAINKRARELKVTLKAGFAEKPKVELLDMVDTAKSAGTFNTLLAAAAAAELVATLKDGELTLFAPTDEAFAKLPEGTVDGLLADKEKLTAVLTYHVFAGRYSGKLRFFFFKSKI